MSMQADCFGCSLGQHSRHDPDWGVKPGLIGGETCDCAGDCAERYARKAAELSALLHAPRAADLGGVQS